ncbi:alpha-tocopherol transfer protein-like [Bicyclus anynana]|uniref:Alpha-tocopherol transfer protein-like n=1 Tax=Bicyclus anynana TaxID=110368 RepID=A0A6J1P5N9_BICAN|nr:alpha-tocopherol transfer protein-like [Bicyclus anynana]
MEFVQTDKILEVRPDTKEYVRKLYNLDKPGSLEDAINILKEWVQMQPHFNKKDFSDRYLETYIIVNKGSVERAKEQLDRLCTMKTVLPQYFGNYNIKTDFEYLHDVANSFLLPKLTEDHYRVNVIKFFNVAWEPNKSINFYRHNVILAEYVKAHDYLSGFVMIIDCTESNLMNLLKNINPVQLRQALSIFIQGFGMRIKGIHIISKSGLVDGLVTLLKQVVSAKVGDRINVHKTFEELHKFIPKAILPKDYGGEERSMKTLQELWLNVLSSEEHLRYLEDINSATTNESCRQKDQFCEQYAGMPGTFRYLSVD